MPSKTAEKPTSIYKPGTLHQVPPGALLLRRNIRDAAPDQALIDSVAAVGVLEPVTAVTDPSGGLVIRFGHRRTLAAVAAKVPTIPVYVTGEDDESKDAEVHRLITQRDENTHRAGLSTAEEAKVVADLALFGLSPDQIAAQARIAQDRVDTALAVSGSTLASKAAAKYEQITLDQAAAVAEFEDDAEVAKELIVTAIERPNQFTHLAQRRRDDREREALLAEARQRLEADGAKVLDEHPGYGSKTTVLLSQLVDAETGEAVTEEAHATCPGRAALITVATVWVDADGQVVDDSVVEGKQEQMSQEAYDAAVAEAGEGADDPESEAYVDEDGFWVDHEEAAKALGLTRVKRGVPRWYCTDLPAGGHKDRYATTGAAKSPAGEMSDAEREAAAKARKLVIENNKAWDSAETVRVGWLRSFASRKTAPKGAAAFIAHAVSRDLRDLLDYQGTPAEDWLGDTVHGALTGASESRALQVALIEVLAAYEKKMDKSAWRDNGEHSRCGRYLRFLESAGYDLSEVEQFAISSKTA